MTILFPEKSSGEECRVVMINPEQHEYLLVKSLSDILYLADETYTSAKLTIGYIILQSM